MLKKKDRTKLWRELFPFLPGQIVRVKRSSSAFGGRVGRIVHEEGRPPNIVFGRLYIVEFETFITALFEGVLEHFEEGR